MKKITRDNPKIAITAMRHSHALIEEDVQIGEKTRIWAFTHILSNVSIGHDCNICDHCLIESGVQIGNRVTIKSGVYIWSGVTLEDEVFIAPGVTFTNDIRPRSKRYPQEYSKTLIKRGASLGANCTVIAGTIIGKYSMVGAGSVVTKNIPDYGLFYGNPARLRAWVCCCGEKLKFISSHAICTCGKNFHLIDDEVVIEKV